MYRKIVTVLALAVGMFLPAQAGEAAVNDWGGLADSALSRFAAADNDHLTVFQYAYAAKAAADRHGWDSPDAQAYLEKAKIQRLWNNDGSLKGYPVSYGGSAIYTVTLADHVGPVMLDAYLHGAATEQNVFEIANLLMKVPTWTTVGKCVSYLVYSASADCVHNQNAAVASFLDSVRAANIWVSGSDALVGAIVRQETYTFNSTVNLWPYSTTQTGIQDADHSALSAEAAIKLYPPIGRLTVKHIMVTTYTGAAEANSPLGHLRAGATDYGRAWIGNWYAEASAYLAAATDPTRFAQVARWSAAIALG
jgi:hypothetical protein